MIPSTDGAVVAGYDFGGDGADLLLCHANGLHAHVWLPLLDDLREHFHCYALDFRGHGHSEVPAGLVYAWEGFGDDVLAVVDHFELEDGLVGAGWSMGGCALVLAELSEPGTFDALWAYEPIIFPPQPTEARPGDSDLSAGARRRRAVFASRDEAYENYASKPPFSVAEPASLRAYVDHGFGDLPDGTVQLCCLPDTEADIFGQSENEAWGRLAEIAAPVSVVGGGDGGPPATFAPLVVAELADGDFELMDDLTHFGPMQDPGRVAQSIIDALAEED